MCMTMRARIEHYMYIALSLKQVTYSADSVPLLSHIAHKTQQTVFIDVQLTVYILNFMCLELSCKQFISLIDNQW